MKRVRYVATRGALFPKKMAQQYGEYLHEVLPSRLGRAPTTEDIIDDAKSNRHCPYRDYFEWDARKAHIQYLRVQARNLINHIAEITIVEGERKICRAFFPILEQRGEPKRWISMDKIRQDPVMLDQVIDSAKRELIYWRDKYDIYNSLSVASRYVADAIREIEQKSKKKPTKPVKK